MHGGSKSCISKYSARTRRIFERSRALVFLFSRLGWNHDELSVGTRFVATISEMTFPFVNRLYTILYKTTFEAEDAAYQARNRINNLRSLNTGHEFESLSLRHFVFCDLRTSGEIVGQHRQSCIRMNPCLPSIAATNASAGLGIPTNLEPANSKNARRGGSAANAHLRLGNCRGKSATKNHGSMGMGQGSRYSREIRGAGKLVQFQS